jgi:hypothetical protein
VCNGEEDAYGGRSIANFSKGLPHNDLGEVDQAAYDALLVALASRDQPTLRPSREAFVRPSSQEQAAIVSCESAISENTSLRLKVPLGPRPVMAPFLWGHCQHGAS